MSNGNPEARALREAASDRRWAREEHRHVREWLLERADALEGDDQSCHHPTPELIWYRSAWEQAGQVFEQVVDRMDEHAYSELSSILDDDWIARRRP